MFGDIFILGFAGLSLIVTLTAPEQVIYVSEDEMSDIEKDALALELYLKDKEDHKKHCPKIKWEQPSIDEYKKDLESKLPSNCKK